MGKKSKIKKITEKQYMEYVAGLKNEPVTPPEGNGADGKKGEKTAQSTENE